MSYATLRLCSGRGSYEAIPRPKLSLNLADAAERLRGQGVSVTDARVMLLIGLDAETTLSRDGRVLIKTGDPLLASEVFERLRAIVGLPAADAPRAGPVPPAGLIPP